MVQDFKQLMVWQKSHEFTLAIYKVTVNFPISEQYSLVSQLRRASSSIGANISEGCGRKTQKDFANFLHNALGSCKECENHLMLSKDLGYLKENEFIELKGHIEEIGKMLNSFIQSVSKTAKP
ncbi:MAG: four helix bundle protein [archaeon]|jgi:four helix bundle protein